MNLSNSSSSGVEPANPLLTRIKAEFLEMPGLQLTPWQAQRLWGLDAKACDDALEALVEGAFLHRTSSGAYRRR
jgi:hypothetical protein